MSRYTDEPGDDRPGLDDLEPAVELVLDDDADDDADAPDALPPAAIPAGDPTAPAAATPKRPTWPFRRRSRAIWCLPPCTPTTAPAP